MPLRKEKESKSITLLSTADWDNPFWTNKQHVAVQLAKEGYKVLYVESVGIRAPTLTSSDIRRIWRRLIRSIRPVRKVREDIYVMSPLSIPFRRFAAIRTLNRTLFQVTYLIARSIAGLSKRGWLWTYSPITLDYFNLRSFSTSIYHCVDEIKHQPGMDQAYIERLENRLCRDVDLIFVTSVQLLETRKILNPRTFYLPNVADFEHFNTATKPDLPLPDDLVAIETPVVGFVGAISGYKVDFELVKFLADKKKHLSFVLIGKIGEGDPTTNATALASIDNVYLLGPKDYKELPFYLKAFDVAIIPSLKNEYTANMFPMKFFEYLAAGVPVVASDISALVPFQPYHYSSTSPQEFIENLEHALSSSEDYILRGIELAREHTYESRTKKMVLLINQFEEDRLSGVDLSRTASTSSEGIG